MPNKKEFVANTVCVQVTPAQQKLLQLVTPVEAEDYFKSLKAVHYLGTYCIGADMADLPASGLVHQLIDALNDIVIEKLISNRKTN